MHFWSDFECKYLHFSLMWISVYVDSNRQQTNNISLTSLTPKSIWREQLISSCKPGPCLRSNDFLGLWNCNFIAHSWSNFGHATVSNHYFPQCDCSITDKWYAECNCYRVNGKLRVGQILSKMSSTERHERRSDEAAFETISQGFGGMSNEIGNQCFNPQGSRGTTSFLHILRPHKPTVKTQRHIPLYPHTLKHTQPLGLLAVHDWDIMVLFSDKVQCSLTNWSLATGCQSIHQK